MIKGGKIKIVIIICFVVISGTMYSCSNNTDNDIIIKKDENITTGESRKICIHISGFVLRPGVYNVDEGTRVHQVIALAGGFLDEADRDFLNLAMEVTDGMKIQVYSVDEVLELNNHQDKKNIININFATKEELMNLPGIGEAKAKSIIEYRESNGLFKEIDEIKNISGIKENAFDKIKDLITI